MAFSINEIKSTISDMGFQKPTHFACSIILPPSMSDGFDYSLHRTNSVNLPGFNLTTDDYRHKGYGLTEKRPIQTSFEDINVTIIADAEGRIANTLQKWFEFIYPIDDRGGDQDVEYFEYPNQYYGGLEIYVYDLTGKMHTTYTFERVFPTMLGGISMSWESTNGMVMIPVSFAYRTYRKNSSFSGATSIFATIDTNAVNTTLAV